MKKLIFKLVVFIVIAIPLCYLFQWVIDTGLKKSSFSPEYKEWYEIMHSKANADILIQGSSRAWVHISPKMLEDSFHTTAYNLGLDGQNFPIQKVRLDIYRKYNSKPKYIIQAVDANFFINPIVTYDFDQFIPYLNDDFGSILKEHSFFTSADFYIPLYKYSHSPGIATGGFLNFFNKDVKDNGKYKGFKTYDYSWNQEMLDTFQLSYPKGFRVVEDVNTYRKFVDFLRTCKQENIHVILVYTPVQKELQDLIVNRDTVINQFKSLSKEYNIPYLDYSQAPISTDKTYFYNANHLNAKGVAIFNKQLISDLKGIIQ